MLEVVREQAAGFTTQFHIYHEDGTYLAKLIGSQLHRTKDGEKVGLVLHHPPLKTVCELNGKTIIELTRSEAAALKTEAELFAPGGVFLKCGDSHLTGFIRRNQGEPLVIENNAFFGNIIQDREVGIWVNRYGSVRIGKPPVAPR